MPISPILIRHSLDSGWLWDEDCLGERVGQQEFALQRGKEAIAAVALARVAGDDVVCTAS